MQKKKKILIVSQHFWPESFRINDICDFLLEKDCDIEVLCGLPNYPKGDLYDGYSALKNRRQNHKGMSVHRALEVPRGNNSNIRIFLNYISFPLSSLLHIPRLMTKKIDKIFLFQTSPVMMSLAGIIIGKLKRVETTMYVLDLWPENLFSVLDIKNPFLRRFITGISHWHYKKTDKLIVLSEAMKRQLQQVTNKSDECFIVLPQVAEKLYEVPVSDPALDKKFSKGFNVVFTGNLSPAQSFNTMLDAADILKKEKLNDIRWVIVGDGMSRKQIEKDIKKRKLDDIFHFEGQKPVSDMPKYINVADVLVGCLVKSDLLEATIPAKVMSYIAAGKPIVLAMDGEVQDLINKRIKNGFAGETENGPLLAENIKKIFNLSKTERKLMGERAHRYHFRHFERNLVLSKLYNFIFSIND